MKWMQTDVCVYHLCWCFSVFTPTPSIQSAVQSPENTDVVILKDMSFLNVPVRQIPTFCSKV